MKITLPEWFAPSADREREPAGPPSRPSTVQHIGRMGLGAALLSAGVGHLTWARTEFLAQVPSWFPVDADAVVVGSGIVELALGGSLIALPRHRVPVGWTAAAFFVVIFPGNIAQFVEHKDGFGLDTDAQRGVRLLFQPALVAWALWSTGAWAARRASRR
jgi:uncharacterized membrane protein